MSIYISLPTLYDNQIDFTIKSAINNADKPKEIFIGLVLMETNNEYLNYDLFYKNKILPIIDNANIKFKRFKHNEYEQSVGFGRNQALSMYDNQDYILQIDSHTFFEKSWDTKLIMMYNESLFITKNNKTILTCYLPAYKNVKNEIFEIEKNNFSKYPFITNEHWNNTKIPRWIDSRLEKNIKNNFLPSIKFNAQFAFSNINYFNNNGLPTETVFWEEEVIQTINLIDLGFSLVFPNCPMPLFHLFIGDIEKNDVLNLEYRVSGGSPEGKSFNQKQDERMNIQWLNFINNPLNEEKINRFFNYSKINLKNNTFEPNYIPTNFINSY